MSNPVLWLCLASMLPGNPPETPAGISAHATAQSWRWWSIRSIDACSDLQCCHVIGYPEWRGDQNGTGKDVPTRV